MQDDRRQSVGTWKSGAKQLLKVLLFVLVMFLVLTGVFTSGILPHHVGPSARPKLVCMNNLRQIGALLLMRMQMGEDIYDQRGAHFLLQVAPEVDAADLRVFLCEGDDRHADLLDSSDRDDRLRRMFKDDRRTAPCSYLGPDEELLSQLRENPNPEIPLIIACDMNGTDGQQPHHPNGVVCLWSDSKVTFTEWEEMEGYDGEPVPVGPNSPDPRFRHLVP